MTRYHKIICALINLVIIIIFLANIKIDFTIQYESSETTTFSFYYDKGSDFNETNIANTIEDMFQNQSSSNRVSINFSPLGFRNLNNLRIDFNSKNPELKINKISINYKDNYSYIFNLETFPELFNVTNDIKSINFLDEKLIIKYINNDAYMYPGNQEYFIKLLDDIFSEITPMVISDIIMFLFLLAVVNCICMIVMKRNLFNMCSRITRLFSRLQCKKHQFYLLGLTVIVTLMFVMSFISSYNAHPDENVSERAVSYYQNNLTPPNIMDENISDTFSGYGNSRLRELTVYYQLNAIVSWILGLVSTLSPIILFRVFNLILFIIMAAIVINKKRASLLIPLIMSAQVWYIFSYVTSDAWDFLMGFIIMYQLIDDTSMLHFYLDNEKIFDKKSFGYCIFISLVFASIFLGKQNYYIILLFTFFILFYKLMETDKTKRKQLFIKYITILGLVGLFFMIRYLQFEIIHDFNRTNLLVQAKELYQISNLDEVVKVQLKSRGYPFSYVLELGWFKTSFKSLFGVYGNMKYFASDFIYTLLWVLNGSILAIGILFNKYLSKDKKYHINVILSVLLCVFCTVGISLYHSWTSDYQAQGRYLLPIILISSYLFKDIDKDTNKYLKTSIYIIMIITFIINIYSFLYYGISKIN